MKKIVLSFSLSVVFIINNLFSTNGQNINNFSNKNYVHAINITHDTVWIGSSGGVVVRNTMGDLLASYTVDNGLNSNFITSIAVDSAGNKWFGTFDNGLIKFNNGQWQYFNSNIDAQLMNGIFSLEVDGQGHIWAGLSNGVVQFDGISFHFFTTASSILGKVKAICVDTDANTIWAGSETNGLYKYSGTWEKITANGILSNNINDIAATNDSLIIATTEGVAYYLKSTNLFHNFPEANNIYLSTAIDPVSKTLWIGTENALYYYSGTQFLTFGAIGMQAYPVLEFGSNGELWSGFREAGQGVMRSDMFGLIGNYSLFEDVPSTNTITDILATDNKVYFSTVGKGIIAYNGVWEDYYYMEAIINDLAIRNDTLFAATPNGYTLIYNYNYAIFPKPFAINATEIDKDGLVWFGTNNGLFSWNNFTEGPLLSSGLLDPKIIKIAVDSINRLWLLHKNGITLYNRTSFNPITLSDMGLSGAELFDIAVDTLGGIWIGSSQGVVFYNGNLFSHLMQSDGLINNKVLSVAIDKQNIKYFGTPSGISLHKNVNWKNIGRSEKIAVSVVSSIDKQNSTHNLWLAGNYGGITTVQFFPLNIYLSQANTILCPGQTVTFVPMITGGIQPEKISYSWTSSDGTINSIEPTLSVRPANTTIYYLKVTDGFMHASDSVKIEIKDYFPSPIYGPQQVCSNTTIAGYSVPFDMYRSYNWTVQGGEFLTQNGFSDIQVNWDVAAQNHYIELNEYDLNTGCSSTQKEDINIENIRIPEIIRKGENLILCTDSGMAKYIWMYSDYILPVPERQFLYIDKSNPGYEGLYQVQVISQNGCMAVSEPLEFYDVLLNAFPNPVKDLLTIRFYRSEKSTGFIEIRNQHGILQHRIHISNHKGTNQISVSVNNYKTGVYSYLITLGSEKIQGKFVVE